VHKSTIFESCMSETHAQQVRTRRIDANMGIMELRKRRNEKINPFPQNADFLAGKSEL
jgi:hypothetical protein